MKMPFFTTTVIFSTPKAKPAPKPRATPAKKTATPAVATGTTSTGSTSRASGSSRAAAAASQPASQGASRLVTSIGNRRKKLM